jgi:TolB-like protein/DNA-binding winged helix-turn-helix (wHTH) protein
VAQFNQPRILRFGSFEVDLQAGELRKSGMHHRLVGQPYEVLRLLLERRGEIVTREELRQRIWPEDTFVDYDLALRKAVAHLREVLGDSAENPHFIETVPRRGYRFVGALSIGGFAGIQETEPPARATNTSKPNRFLRKGIVLGFGAMSMLTALLALMLANIWRRLTGRGEAPEIRSIAVLPLQNLSGDPTQEYFSDGMTDALITDLAQIGSVKVISRTSTTRYKNTHMPLPEIARELNVDGIVEGTVQRSGDHVGITVALIHGPSDRHIWASSYKRDVRDALGLEQQVAADVAGQIQARLTKMNKRPPSQPRPVNLKLLMMFA